MIGGGLAGWSPHFQKSVRPKVEKAIFIFVLLALSLGLMNFCGTRVI